MYLRFRSLHRPFANFSSCFFVFSFIILPLFMAKVPARCIPPRCLFICVEGPNELHQVASSLDRPAFAGRLSGGGCTHLQRTLYERPANAGNGILYRGAIVPAVCKATSFPIISPAKFGKKRLELYLCMPRTYREYDN